MFESDSEGVRDHDASGPDDASALRRSEAHLDHISSLLAARDRLDAQLATAIAHANDTGAWRAAGARSPRRFLRTCGAQTGADATRLLRLARIATPASPTAHALGATLRLGHAAALAEAVTPARLCLFRRDETVLLTHATTLTLADFETVLAHWAACCDQELGTDNHQPGQHLHIQQRLDGGADLRGTLDEPSTATVLAALHRHDTGPDSTTDPAARTLPERRADALTHIATLALDATTTGDRDARSHHPVNTTTIVVDVRTVTSAPARTEDLDQILAEHNGRTISARAIDRLLCGTWIAAALRDADGAIIDATQRTQAFSPTKQRLIAARDGHCVFPGCDRAPSWCDTHHLHHRAHGGNNHIDNGVLLCRPHHRLLHNGWQLRPSRSPQNQRPRRRTAWTATSPTGRIWTGRPPPAPPAADHPPNTS